LAVATSFAMWMLCAQQYCRAGSNRLQDKWLSTYLQEVSLKHIVDTDDRKAEANNLASFPLYAGMFGGLFGGGVSDWVLRRHGRRAGRNGVAVAGLLIAIVCYLPLFFFHDAAVQIILFCVGSFVGSGVNSCAYAMSMDIGGKNVAVIFSTMNMIGNLGSWSMTDAFGRVSEWRGGWQNSLMLFVAVQAIAVVCWLFLNPNRNIGEEKG
jgi:MFS family permease